MSDDDLIDVLQNHRGSDHVRGCQGRQYSCTCGFDIATDTILGRSEEEVKRLRSQLVNVKQHVGWLKQYYLGTTEENWRDMKLRAERQLGELSTLLTDD